jgi:hypothetical protein
MNPIIYNKYKYLSLKEICFEETVQFYKPA